MSPAPSPSPTEVKVKLEPPLQLFSFQTGWGRATCMFQLLELPPQWFLAFFSVEKTPARDSNLSETLFCKINSEKSKVGINCKTKLIPKRIYFLKMALAANPFPILVPHLMN